MRKTLLLSILKLFIYAQDPEAHVIATAPTHVAAALMKSKTNEHVLRKYAKAQGKRVWFLLDEFSMMTLDTLAEFAKRCMVGQLGGGPVQARGQHLDGPDGAGVARALVDLQARRGQGPV